MRLVLTTGPTVEPVTTAEMKLHSRIDTDADDAKIAMFITAAREYVESITGRQLINATYTMKLNMFPIGEFMELPKAPLGSVTSVQYLDTANTTQTFSSSNYTIDNSIDSYGRIIVDRDVGWPSTYDTLNAVTVVYVAGYGATSASVPERYKQLIMLIAADWYENREGNIIGTSAIQLPTAVKSLIENLKLRAAPNLYGMSGI